MNSVKILHAVRSAITAIAELLVSVSLSGVKVNIMSHNIIISRIAPALMDALRNICREKASLPSSVTPFVDSFYSVDVNVIMSKKNNL